MAKTRFAPATILIVLSALLCFPACSRRETPVDEGIRTGTLLIGNSAEPADLDPHVVDAYTDMIVLAALYEGLTVLDERTSQARPGVAERWESTADGLTWTFHLRGDARWSNGDAVTARDFAFSFQRLLHPSFGSVGSYLLWPVRNAEAYTKGTITDFGAVGVEVVDDRTLRLRLAHPAPYLPALAAHAAWLPLHRATLEKFDAVAKRGTAWTRPGNLVGNGPFQLVEWAPNSRLVVAKNPRHWDAARNRLERVVFFPIEKADVEERNFRAGQLHLTFDLPPSRVAAHRAASPSPLRIDPLLQVMYMNFNVARPPLDDARVRRALSLAIDREAIARAVFQGTRAAAGSFTPPDCGEYTARARVTADFGAARRLLAEAGYPEGRGLPAFPVQVQNDSNYPRVMEAIQAMWQRELGVRSSIEPFEQKTWLQNQQSKRHTIGLMGWTGDFADPRTFLGILASDNGNNWTNWSHRGYDDLLARADRTADTRGRLELFQEAEALLLTESPVAPIVFGARTYLQHPAVRNWDPSPLGLHRFQRVELRP
ncbi:MAG: peptide ABC transporter substrate-binding protein [Verrucomicrobia bacterium]|nr:peptide ABC transporter substrate-binding protein [Verrucomicrobiota bacterium]